MNALRFRRKLVPLLSPFLLILSFVAAESPDVVGVYARGQYAKVIELLEPKHKEEKCSIQERILLARAFLHLDKTDASLPVLKSVLETDGENPEANSLAGQVLHRAGKYKEAIPYLEHAYRLKQDPVTASTLGQSFYALGDFSKAKVHLRKALEEDIRNPQNSFLLGKIYLARGLGALAEKYFLAAEEAGLDSPELHLLLGQAYLAQRKFVGPIHTETIEGKPEPGEFLRGEIVLGPVKGSTDRYRVCSRYCALYEGCLLERIEPIHDEARHMLAAGWLAAGEPAKAETHLRALLSTRPGFIPGIKLMAYALLARKDFAGFEKYLGQVQGLKELEPRAMANFYYRAALLKRAAGERDQAIQFLKKAEQQLPTSAKVLRALGDLHLAQGHREEASGYFARIVELFPDAHDIDRLINVRRNLQASKGGG